MNKVIIRTDTDSDMRQIEVNGVIIEEGNFWDFDLVDTLTEVLSRVNVEVEEQDYEYEY